MNVLRRCVNAAAPCNESEVASNALESDGVPIGLANEEHRHCDRVEQDARSDHVLEADRTARNAIKPREPADVDALADVDRAHAAARFLHEPEERRSHAIYAQQDAVPYRIIL